MAGPAAFQPNDSTVGTPTPEAQHHPFADVSASALTSPEDSRSASKAMRPSAQSATGLTDLQITGDDENPYGNKTPAQIQDIMSKFRDAVQTGNTSAEAEALGIKNPDKATEQQVDTALEQVVDAEQPTFHITQAAKHNAESLKQAGETKLFSDMTTNDPKEAKAAAEHYFDAVFKDQSKQTLSALRDQFHKFRGNIDAATDLMGISTPVSVPVMNAMGNLLDKRAPESLKQRIQEALAPPQASIDYQIRSGS